MRASWDSTPRRGRSQVLTGSYPALELIQMKFNSPISISEYSTTAYLFAVPSSLLHGLWPYMRLADTQITFSFSLHLRSLSNKGGLFDGCMAVFPVLFPMATKQYQIWGIIMSRRELLVCGDFSTWYLRPFYASYAHSLTPRNAQCKASLLRF